MKVFLKKHKLGMFLGIVILAVVIILITTILRLNVRAQSNACVELGNRYLSELNYEQAIVSFQQALDIEPKNVAASYGLAEAYDVSEMYIYAENIYQGILEQDNTQEEAYEKLADLYIRQDKLEEAKKLLEEAMENTDSENLRELYRQANPQPPAADWQPGAYSRRIRVALSTDRQFETIYYTTDGTDPTVESASYNGPIILKNGQTTIRAIAVNALGFSSDVAEFSYDIQVATVEVPVEERTLEEIIRRALDIPGNEPIYNDDIERITELYIVSSYVRSNRDENSVLLEKESFTLNGVVYGVYNYSGSEPVTLNDLRNMPFLERVVIEYIPELDISALGSCGSVKELSLIGDELTDEDIAVLAQMPQLEQLCLGWNNITDLSSLGQLTNLNSLGLWGNQIEVITPVEGMTELTYLDFSDNRISDISAVAGLEKLQNLWMYHNRISDISPITGLDNLRVLMLRDNPVSNPGEVRKIYPHLTRIDVDLLGLGEEQ